MEVEVCYSQSFHEHSKHFEWEEREKSSRSETISSLHYKINLFSNSFHKWRLFILQSRVKRRLKDVARIHYEGSLVALFFLKWKSRNQEEKELIEKKRHKILRETFNHWKQTMYLQRVFGQRSVQSAKEYHKKLLLKHMFNTWKCERDKHKADRFRTVQTKRQIMKLWKLQHYKRTIQRRLAKYHHKHIVVRTTFFTWMCRLEEKQDIRLKAIVKMNNIWLKSYFDRLKLFKEQKKDASAKTLVVIRKQRLGRLHHYILLWRQKTAIALFSQRHILWHKKILARKYFVEWRAVMLTHTFEGRRNALVLKDYFTQWKCHKEEAIHEKRKENEIRKLLDRRSALLHFYHWRLETQQELLIRPMLQTAQQKSIERCFSGWSDWTNFRRQAKIFRRSWNLRKTGSIFSKWRKGYEKATYVKKLLRQKENEIIEMSLHKWNAYVSYKKVNLPQKVEVLARHWLDVTQQKKMDREIEKADMVNVQLTTRVYFTKWLHNLQKLRFKRKEMTSQADLCYQNRISHQTFVRWKREYEIRNLVRDHLQEKEFEFVLKVFSAWFQFTRAEVQHQINAFNERCDISSNYNLTISNPQQHMTGVLSSSLNQTHQDFKSTSSFKEADVLEDNIGERSVDSVETNDRSFLNGFTYDSEYEMDGMFSSGDKSDIYGSPEIIRYSPSLDENKSSSKHPISWTDEWKRRYLESQEVALLRRNPDERRRSAFETVSGNEICSLSQDGNNSVYSQLTPYPKPHDVLNRSLPFVRRCSSYEDVLTSGVCSFDEDVASVASTMDIHPKGSLLLGTIKHWRHYDISSVFYAWLKYVARKKFHRQMLQSHLETKENYLLHRTLLKWNRRLYVLQASNDFYWKQTTRRYLYQWKQFTSLQHRKEEQKKTAVTFNENMLLSKYITMWKTKYHSKRCLNGIAKVWIKASFKNTIHEKLIHQHRQRWNHFEMKIIFTTWKHEERKTKLARQHYNDSLINKVLNVWWCLVLVKESEKKKVKNFQMKHCCTQKFLIWKRRFEGITNSNIMFQSKQNLLTKNVFRAWLQRTQALKHQDVEMLSLICKRNDVLKREAFQEWLVVWRQHLLATSHCNITSSRKVFISWNKITKNSKEMENKLENILHTKRQEKVRNTFSWWKINTQACIKYRVKTSRTEAIFLREHFIHWRKVHLQRKCREFLERHALNKCFNVWKNAFVYKNKETTLMKQSSKKWLARFQVTQENEKSLQSVINDKQMAILRIRFIFWRKQTRMTIEADKHFIGLVLQKNFDAWMTFSKNAHSMRQAYTTWTKKHNDILIASTFHIWRNDMIKSVKLKVVRNNLLQCNVRRLAKDWRLKVKATKFGENRRQILMKRSFQIWKQNLEDQLKAERFHEFYLCKKSFYQWKTCIERKIFLHKQAKKMLLQRQTTMLQVHYDKWLKEFKKVKKTKEIEQQYLQMAIDHEKGCLLYAYFRRWKISLFCSRIRIKRENEILRKYADKWLRIVQMNQLANRLHEQYLFNRIWMQWRREYTKRNVIKTLIQQDQRKVKSEIFFAWCDYSRLKNTLPKALSIEKQKIWFRKWMSIYNSS